MSSCFPLCLNPRALTKRLIMFEHDITWTEEGFDELEQLMLDLADKFPVDTMVQRTAVKALKRAMMPVYETALMMAPYDNENPRSAYRPIHMKDTIRLNARLPNTSDQESVYFEPGDIALGSVSVKKSAVSLAQEFGTSKIPSHPFLRPALAYNATKVVDILRDELTELVFAYTNRMNRKSGNG